MTTVQKKALLEKELPAWILNGQSGRFDQCLKENPPTKFDYIPICTIFLFSTLLLTYGSPNGSPKDLVLSFPYWLSLATFGLKVCYQWPWWWRRTTLIRQLCQDQEYCGTLLQLGLGGQLAGLSSHPGAQLSKACKTTGSHLPNDPLPVRRAINARSCS